MTIVLSALPEGQPFWMVAVALALAGALITLAVYGAVGMIVKADDLGLAMAAKGRLALTRMIGVWIVQGMPTFMRPYRSDAVQTVPDAVILACQDHGAAAVSGWFSCWLPWMAREVDPPASPNRLDR